MQANHKVININFSFIRLLLVFAILIFVKSFNTFSEERTSAKNSVINGISGVEKFTIDISDKSFSFIMDKLPLANESAPDIKPTKKEVLKLSLDISSKGKLSANQLSSFLAANNPALNPAYALRMATVYKEEAADEGINADVAFSQMCLETAFLKFGGDVLPVQNNFCGLGTTGHGVQGFYFSDMRAGIRAHIQHLKAYASNNNLVNPIVDNRFKYVKRGSAPNVNKLTGKWASDKNYGNKIQSLMAKMYAMESQ